jgi:uncharacterized LabA/DUF88 family protein
MPDEVGQAQLYVDAAYVREALKQLGINPWFGPTELRRQLQKLHIDGRRLSIRRIIFYDAVDGLAPTAKDHERHLEELGRLPDVLVRLGTVTGTKNRRQKGVDMRMGRDMMVAAQSSLIDYIVLVSGDADFIPAIQQVQDLGPKVLVLAFHNSLSSELVLEADRVILLPENADRNWAH